MSLKLLNLYVGSVNTPALPELGLHTPIDANSKTATNLQTSIQPDAILRLKFRRKLDR